MVSKIKRNTLILVVLATLTSIVGCKDSRSSAEESTPSPISGSPGLPSENSNIPKTEMPKESGVSNIQFSKTGSTSFDINATDSSGEPISCDENDLSIALEISRDGSDDSFESISQDNIIVSCDTRAASDIALVLDNSGSEKDHMDDIIAASSNMANEVLNNGGQVSITRVSTNSKVLGPLSSDSVAVKSAISQQKNGNGWTSLFDGIRLGNETLANSSASEISTEDELTSFCESNRKLGMVVFTDGRENNSNDEKSYRYDFIKYPGDGISTTKADLFKLRVGNVITPIYNVGMGPDVDHELLSAVSKATGGKYLHIESKEQIANVFDIVKDYITTPTQVCAKFSKNICGSRKLKMKYNWRPKNSNSETTSKSSEKIVNVHIPCEGQTDSSDQLVDDKSESEEVVSDGVESSLAYPNNVFADNRNTKLYFPPFDDNNGKKELLGVRLEYALKGSGQILAANLGSSLSKSSEINMSQKISINGDISGKGWDFSKNYDEITKFNELEVASKDDLQMAKEGKNNGKIGVTSKGLVLSGKHRFLSQDYKAFKGYRPFLVNISHQPYAKVTEDSDPNINYNLDFQVTGDVRLVYEWRTIEKPFIKFLDRGLELAVRSVIKKNEGNIYIEDVSDISTLNISNKSIRSLEGLQYFKSLKSLNASNNKLDSISQLEGLVQLETLNLSRNKLSSVEAISSLKNLSYLNLNTNIISSITPLEAMTGLTSLYIGNNNVSDISTLKGFSLLSRLGVNSNSIKDISPLSNLIGLTYLYMNNISCECDISLLSKLDKLYYLNLSGNSVLNEELLVNFSKLRKLYLNGIQNFDYNVISKLNLNTLYLTSNSLENVDFLKGLTSLQRLSLAYNKLTKECLEVLSTLVNMKQIWLNNNQINERIDLSSLSKLTQINLDSNSIEKLDLNLASPNSVSKVWLRNNSLSNLEGLNFDTKNLTRLYLDNNNLVSLKGLEQLTSITHLYLRYNKLTSIDYVKYLQDVTHLYFEGNQISNLGSLLGLENIRVARFLKNILTCDDQKILVDMKYAGKTVSYSNLKDCKYQYIKSQPPVEEEKVEEVVIVYGESSSNKFVTGNSFTVLNSSTREISDSLSEKIQIDKFDDENGNLEVYEIKVQVMANAGLESISRNFSSETLTGVSSSIGNSLNVEVVNQDKVLLSKSDDMSVDYLQEGIKSSTIDDYNDFIRSNGSVHSDLFPKKSEELELFSEFTVEGEELSSWLSGNNISISFSQKISARSDENSSSDLSIVLNSSLSGTLFITYKYKKKQ